MKITFIGLGIMGSRMASHLLKEGIELTVYNRSNGPAKALEAFGARAAKSVEEAVRDAEIVFSMLSKPEVVEKLMIEQALPSMKSGTIWIDCSTVNPSFTQKAHQKAEEFSIRYLEAPVAGTKPQAEAGELVFFVGGDTATLNDIQECLQYMGSKVMHLGAVSKGASFKMLINMMLGMSMVAFSESVKLGEALGFDVNMLLNLIPNLPVSAPFLKMKAEMMKEDDYETQFPLELLYKDLHLAMVTASEKELSLPFTNTAKEVYSEGVEGGLGRKDMIAIHEIN